MTYKSETKCRMTAFAPNADIQNAITGDRPRFSFYISM